MLHEGPGMHEGKSVMVAGKTGCCFLIFAIVCENERKILRRPVQSAGAPVGNLHLVRTGRSLAHLHQALDASSSFYGSDPGQMVVMRGFRLLFSLSWKEACVQQSVVRGMGAGSLREAPGPHR